MQSDDAALIQNTKLIVWDKFQIMNGFAFEALDRTLRNIMGNIDSINRSNPFGNKIIVLGGDFRKTLPV